MKITPLEIRQKVFAKAFRGLDKDEVMGFLQSLSQEWEKVMEENKDLKVRLDRSEKEVQKLREVEDTLYKTLKTAEDTGANVVSQANKTAELYLKESQMKVEAMINDAQSQAKNIIEEADEKARMIIEEAYDELKLLQRDCTSIETYRDELTREIKNLVNDTLEKVNKVSGNAVSPSDSIKGKLKEAREMQYEKRDYDKEKEVTFKPEPPKEERQTAHTPTEVEESEKAEKAKPVETPNTSESKSFFDEIGDDSDD